MKTKQSTIIPITAAILSLIGMSLPWARVRGASFSGWSSTANFAGFNCPGYLVAVVAVIAVGLLCFRGQASGEDDSRVSSVLPMVMCAYGLFHAGFMAMAITATPRMHVGVGILVTMLAFGLIVASILFRKSGPMAATLDHA